MHEISLHNLRFAQVESLSPDEKKKDVKLLQSLLAAIDWHVLSSHPKSHIRDFAFVRIGLNVKERYHRGTSLSYGFVHFVGQKW